MITRKAEVSDKAVVLDLLDEFRVDCMEQISGKPAESNTAKTEGAKI